MAAPFLTGNVAYRQDVGVTDVQTIMDNLGTMLVALAPAWTRTAGTVGSTTQSFQSPADAAGRQFTVTYNRISATILEQVGTDGQSRSFTRRGQITTVTANYYISQYHIMLDWSNGEGLSIFMLDESPESQTSHNMWLFMQGPRNAANGADNGWIFGSGAPVRNGNAFALAVNASFLAMMFNNTLNGTTNGIISRTVAGANIWTPCIVMGDQAGANIFNIYGKLYNALGIKDSFVSVDSEVSVPIDQANSAIFRVLNQGAWAPGGINFHDRMAIRKA